MKIFFTIWIFSKIFTKNKNIIIYSKVHYLTMLAKNVNFWIHKHMKLFSGWQNSCILFINRSVKWNCNISKRFPSRWSFQISRNGFCNSEWISIRRERNASSTTKGYSYHTYVTRYNIRKKRAKLWDPTIDKKTRIAFITEFIFVTSKKWHPLLLYKHNGLEFSDEISHMLHIHRSFHTDLHRRWECEIGIRSPLFKHSSLPIKTLFASIIVHPFQETIVRTSFIYAKFGSELWQVRLSTTSRSRRAVGDKIHVERLTQVLNLENCKISNAP